MKKLVVFDLDGTLIDTKLFFIDAFSHTFGKIGMEVNRKKIESLLGRKRMEIFDLYGVPKEKMKEAEKIMRGFEEEEENLGKVKLCAGVRETLDKLSGKCIMAIVTNSYRHFLEGVLKKLDIEKYFDKAIAADDGFRTKAEALEHLAKDFNKTKEETTYVGDTHYDVEAARTTGCKVVIVEGCGFFENVEGADFYMQFKELPKTVI